jgi:hypothetical protein
MACLESLDGQLATCQGSEDGSVDDSFVGFDRDGVIELYQVLKRLFELLLLQRPHFKLESNLLARALIRPSNVQLRRPDTTFLRDQHVR